MTRPARRRGTRAARRLSAAALAALVLTGCGTPVRAGAAAVVGDTSISTEQLAGYVDAGLRDPAAAQQLGGDRAAYQRDVLNRLVNTRIVEVAAQRHGVTVTPGDVDAQYAQIEQSVGGPEQLKTQAAAAGLTLDQVRELARTRALTVALGDKLTAKEEPTAAQYRQAYQQSIDQFDQVRTAQIQLPTLKAARALLPQARKLDDAAFAELAKARSTDVATKERGGDLGFAPRSAFTQNGLEAYGKAAFAAKVGVTFAVASPRAGHVVRVLGRNTTPLEQAKPQLRRVILQDKARAAVEAELRKTAEQLDIRINPRFGRWDDAQLQVLERAAAGDQQVSSPEAPAGGPAAGTAPNAPGPTP